MCRPADAGAQEELRTVQRLTGHAPRSPAAHRALRLGRHTPELVAERRRRVAVLARRARRCARSAPRPSTSSAPARRVGRPRLQPELVNPLVYTPFPRGPRALLDPCSPLRAPPNLESTLDRGTSLSRRSARTRTRNGTRRRKKSTSMNYSTQGRRWSKGKLV